MSQKDNERVRTWKSHDNIWAYGYFFWDWADSSTPVTFDTEHRRFYPIFVSMYGARAGALYYFYNSLMSSTNRANILTVQQEFCISIAWRRNRKNRDVSFNKTGYHN